MSRIIRTSLMVLSLIFGPLALGTPVALAASGAACVNPGGTGGCFDSIQAAVNAVGAGGVVNVAAGTYHEDIQIQKRLSLQGAGAAATIIDATGLSNGLVIQGVTSPTVISGFTVENANLEGILLENDAHVLVANNVVSNSDRSLNPAGPSCPGALPFDAFDCGEAVHLLGTAFSTIASNLVQNNAGGILLTDETGPTHGNTIVGNTVQDNALDCGITLASHVIQPGSPVAPSVGGIYGNTVVNNISQRNGQPHGGGGVGIFAAAPGGAAHDNTVANNTLIDNGLPGVVLHSHTPDQNLNGNTIASNTIAGNGADPEEGVAGVTPQPAGIAVISDPGAAPIAQVSIAANRISNEYYGIFTNQVQHIGGLPSNAIASSVTVPVSSH
jgi:parallel beta-helix repeat protein